MPDKELFPIVEIDHVVNMYHVTCKEIKETDIESIIEKDESLGIISVHLQVT